MLRQEAKIKATYPDGGPVGGDSLYNMQRALELGYTPDATGHWPSVDSETGMFLKSKEHPTAWMEYLYGHALNPELNRTTNVVVNPEGYFGDNQLQYIPKAQYAQGGSTGDDEDPFKSTSNQGATVGKSAQEWLTSWVQDPEFALRLNQNFPAKATDLDKRIFGYKEARQRASSANLRSIEKRIPDLVQNINNTNFLYNENPRINQNLVSSYKNSLKDPASIKYLESRMKSNPQGFTDSKGNIIINNPSGYSPQSISAHELIHKTGITTNKGYETLDKMMKGKFQRPAEDRIDANYDKDEMYPFLMQMRMDNQFQPGEEITPERLKQIRESGPKNHLFKYYDDDQISKYLNTLASNQTQAPMQYAARGGYMYPYGGPVGDNEKNVVLKPRSVYDSKTGETRNYQVSDDNQTWINSDDPTQTIRHNLPEFEVVEEAPAWLKSERENPELYSGSGRADYVPIETALLPASLPFKATTALGKVGKLAAEAVNPIGGFKGTPKKLPGFSNIAPQQMGFFNTKGALQKYPKGKLTQEEIKAFKNSDYYKQSVQEHLELKNKYGDSWTLPNYAEKDLEEAIATGNRNRINLILYGGRNWGAADYTIAGLAGTAYPGYAGIMSLAFSPPAVKNKVLNAAGITSKPGVLSSRDTTINITNRPMDFAKVNEIADGQVILGGEFIEGTNNTVRKAKDWLTATDTYSDKEYPSKNIQSFYGIENGKFKVGKASDFKPNTEIVPRRFGATNINKAILNEGAMRLLDNQGNPIYQNTPNTGKFILYSPSTKEANFNYINTGKSGVDKVNKFLKKNKDAQYIHLDNGRYEFYGLNSDGLTNQDYRDYYQQDLEREGNPGYNMILKAKGGYLYPDGGNLKPSQATRADSIAVLNNSLAVKAHYDDLVKRGYYNKPDVEKDYSGADYYYDNYKPESTNSNILLSSLKTIATRPSYQREYKESHNINTTELITLLQKANQRVKTKDNNKTYLYDLYPSKVDIKAPATMIDRRIDPQYRLQYTSNLGNEIPGGFITGLVGYDPLAITPWDMLTEAQKKERVKKFGRNGVPKSYKENSDNSSIRIDPVKNLAQPVEYKKNPPKPSGEFLKRKGLEDMTSSTLPDLPNKEIKDLGPIVMPQARAYYNAQQNSLYPPEYMVKNKDLGWSRYNEAQFKKLQEDEELQEYKDTFEKGGPILTNKFPDGGTYANNQGVVMGPVKTEKGYYLVPKNKDDLPVVNLPEFEVVSTPTAFGKPNPYSPVSLSEFANSGFNPINWFLPDTEREQQPIDPRTGMRFPASGRAAPDYTLGLGLMGVKPNYTNFVKNIKNAKQELIYNAIDPVGYGVREKLGNIPQNLVRNTFKPNERIARVGKELSPLDRPGSEVVKSRGKARLDSWRLGLGLDQKYNTFNKIGDNLYSTNTPHPTAGRLSHLYNDIQANKINSTLKGDEAKDALRNLTRTHNSLTTGEKSLDNINAIREYLKKSGDLNFMPWEQSRIVEKARNTKFTNSVYDADPNGIMGQHRFDVTDLPDNNIHFQANDTWDLHPFSERGVINVGQKTLEEEGLKGIINNKLKNVEALKVLGGKPFNIQDNFIVDPNTMKVIKRFDSGGYTNPYMYYSGGPMEYGNGGRVLKHIGAGAYALGEGILDTVTMGATDQLTDKGFEYLTKVGNKNMDLSDPATAKFHKTQQQIKGYGNATAAVATGIATGNVQGAISQGTKGLNTAFQASDWASDDFKKWSQGISGVAGVAAGFAGGLNSDSFNTAAKAGTGVAGFGQKAGKIGSFGNQAMGMIGGNQQPLWQQAEARQEYLNSPEHLAMKERENQQYVNQGLSFEQGGDINKFNNFTNSMRDRYKDHRKKYKTGGKLEGHGISEIPSHVGLHKNHPRKGMQLGPDSSVEGEELIQYAEGGAPGLSNPTFVHPANVDGEENIKMPKMTSDYEMITDKYGMPKFTNKSPAQWLKEKLNRGSEFRTEVDSRSKHSGDQVKQIAEGGREVAMSVNELKNQQLIEEEYIAAYGGKINPKKYPGLNRSKKSKGGYVYNAMTQPMLAQGGPMVSNVSQPFDGPSAQNRGGMMVEYAMGGNMYANGGPGGNPNQTQYFQPNEFGDMIGADEMYSVPALAQPINIYSKPGISYSQPQKSIDDYYQEPTITTPNSTELPIDFSSPSGTFEGVNTDNNSVSINPALKSTYDQGWRPEGLSNLKPNQPNQPNQGLTGLDYASMGIQALAPLSQLYYGAKGPDPVNYERITANKIDPTVSIILAAEESRRAQDLAGYNLKQNAPTSGSYMSNMRGLGLGAGKNRGLQSASLRQAADVENARTQTGVNAQNAQISMQEQIDRLQEKDAARTNVTEGLSGLGSSTANMIRDYRTNQVNQTIAKNIGTNDWKFDPINETITFRNKDGNVVTVPAQTVIPSNVAANVGTGKIQNPGTSQFQTSIDEGLNTGFTNRFRGPNSGK
jgi:hypothetical protein